MDPNPDTAHFSSIPWCRTLMSDPAYVIVASRSRYAKPDGEDLLTGQTINSPSTISAWLTLIKNPGSEFAPVEELHALLTLGPALDGYPHVCHGGIQATILDEVMGNLVGSNAERKVQQLWAAGDANAIRASPVTAELTMKYLRPVLTPSTVLVVVKLTKSEGRKAWIDGTIEDSTGNILVKASGLFIEAKMEKI